MTHEEAITASDIRVEYRPFTHRVPTFRRAVASRRIRSRQAVMALAGVSFSVAKGEALGVIGANGAGKSTLLRVIAGTLKPDAGHVHVHGQISTLLQLGAGFNAELSGRINVMLAGLAAGLTRSEVRERFDAIVDYAGLHDAIDRPVKTYSSGMFSRLAFSVAMSLDPDVLLVDEVLAVGDEAFRQRSEESMNKLLANSGTLLFVSHSLSRIPKLCPRTLWLDRGSVRQVGPSEDVIDAYKNAINQRPQ